MTLVETRERIRKARNALEPLVSGTGKHRGARMNNILTLLAKEQASVEAEQYERDHKNG